jgi:HD-like signal output (HDOD) protein
VERGCNPRQRPRPLVPATPSALFQLKLALSGGVCDLEAATTAIKSDIGLTVHLLCLCAGDIDDSCDRLPPISELVVHAGHDRLQELVETTASLPACAQDRSHVSSYVRFWEHARLTAMVAEDLSRQTTDLFYDEGFLAGVLYQLGDLASLLGWEVAELGTRDVRERASETAREWGLPNILVEVARGEKSLCSSAKARVLLDLADTASGWANRLESLAARELSSSPVQVLSVQ